MKGFNPIGTRTLYKKEVTRFLKVYNQTLLAPVITSLLYLAVFNLAIGNKVHNINNVDFHIFMAAGLIMMANMQNAFANTSSSFVMGKVLGTLIDYLMPPLSAGEITFAMIAAGITRGILVSILVGLSLLIFIDFDIHSPLIAFFFLVAAATLLSLLGLLAGIIAETFDQMSAFTSYIITPLAFLSGTFYSIKDLPEFWQYVSYFNPFFYMIDGFRYGMTGVQDGNILIGAIFLITTVITLWAAIFLMIEKGYRIKE